MTRPALRRLVSGVASLAIALTLPVAAGGPASAAVAAPTRDDASTVAPATGDVTLAWNPVSGATRYRFALSTDVSFASSLAAVETAGLRATPIIPLPSGTIYWRVAAFDGSTWGAWSDSWSFVRDTLVGPSVVSPVIASPPTAIDYPAQPVLIWTPVTGARTYTVQYSTDEFFGSSSSATTASTSYAIPTLPARGPTWFWRVRATLNTSGLTTEWSNTGTFTTTWSAQQPTLVAPADDPTGATPVSDLRFEWNAVPGAAKYRLYVSTDPAFTSLVSLDGSSTSAPIEVLATEFNPLRSPGNAAYYWRVAAVDPAGNAGTPSATWQLTRSWGPTSAPVMTAGQRLAAPTVLDPDTGGAYPSAGVTTTLENFRLQWTAVPRASMYEVWVSTDSTFTNTDASVLFKCYTPHTSLTTYDAYGDLSAATDNVKFNGNCLRTLTGSSTFGTFNSSNAAAWPGSPPTLYWRVRALDLAASDTTTGQNPGNVDALPRFIRSAWSDRDRGTDPTQPPEVTITAPNQTGDNGPVLTTPPALTGPANCTDPTTCEANPDTPELTWAPLKSAVRGYWVQIALDSGFSNQVIEFHTFSSKLRMDGGLKDNQANQAYYWRVMGCSQYVSLGSKTCLSPDLANVRAFRKAGKAPTLLVSAPTSDQVRFSWQEQLVTAAEGGGSRGYEVQVSSDALFNTITLSAKVDQPFYTTSTDLLPDGTYYWRVRALDGVAFDLPWSSVSSFTKTAAKPSTLSAPNGATTPALKWNSVSGSASYEVEIYSGTNLSVGGSRVVSGTSIIGTAYSASTALSPGTYSWRVRRVDANGNKSPWSSEPGGAVDAFAVTLGSVTLNLPATGALLTLPQRQLSWSAVTGAVRYRAQTSTSASFSSFADNVDTVQTRYALTSTSYQPATTYYWRVQTLTAAGGVLSTSATRTFTVKGLSVLMVKPTATAPTRLATSIPLAWSASDAYNGIKSFQVQRAVKSPGGTLSTWSNYGVTTTATSTTMGSAAPGYSYCFRVRATDKANNVATSPSRCQTIPLDERSLTAVGSWGKVSTTSTYAWRSTLLTSSTKGAYLKLASARGKTLAVTVKKVRGGGTICVYYAGACRAYIPTAATTTQWKQTIRVSVPTSGSAVLLRVYTSGKPVTIDGLAVLP